MRIIVGLLASVLLIVGVNGQWEPNFHPGRQSIVHLFEWTWNSIAKECEDFLGPYGYGGVQVSPVSENRIVYEHEIKRPWYERYQPVSYKLDKTRSGTDKEFRSMVSRCNAAGVRIYVDTVINHMTGGGSGTGTAGSYFNQDTKSFPGVPYSSFDFNGPNECHTQSGNIESYAPGHEAEIRNCRLNNLIDLKAGSNYVRGKILEYLNKLISIGVAGFRFDASKHMWPGDVEYIVKNLNNLAVEHGFPSNARPFIYQEVIDLGGEAVSSDEYLHVGRITEFKWGLELGMAIKKMNGKTLAHFNHDFMPSTNAITFVDNHDNQRGHGAGGEFVVNFKNSRQYKIAQAFTLANNFGITRVMSSYNFNVHWEGPPHDGNYNTLPVETNSDLTCRNGWVCEHRWRQIYNMVRFRNVAAGEPVTKYWSNNFHQVAFSRGSKAFIAINNENFGLNARIQTDMASGRYCDIISGNLQNGSCTGKIVDVDGNGFINVNISNTEEDPMIAIHIESRL